MLNFLGTLSVLFLFCCIIPSAMLKSIFRRSGKMPLYPIIIAHGLIWGYLFSGLVTLGILPLWQLLLAVVLNCLLCVGVTKKGYADIVMEYKKKKEKMQQPSANALASEELKVASDK